MHLEWWYWVVAGLGLIGIELIIPTFTIIWFGFGALAVGAATYVMPDISTGVQMMLWSVASVSCTYIWFRYFRSRDSHTRAGMSKEGIVGETGIVIAGTEDSFGRGTVRFRISVMGADEWKCYSDDVLKLGDSVRVTDIEGQILKVRKI